MAFCLMIFFFFEGNYYFLQTRLGSKQSNNHLIPEGLKPAALINLKLAWNTPGEEKAWLKSAFFHILN